MQCNITLLQKCYASIGNDGMITGITTFLYFQYSHYTLGICRTSSLKSRAIWTHKNIVSGQLPSQPFSLSSLSLISNQIPHLFSQPIFSLSLSLSLSQTLNSHLFLSPRIQILTPIPSRSFHSPHTSSSSSYTIQSISIQFISTISCISSEKI